MKQALLFMSGVVVTLLAAASAVAGGLNLAWDNCPSEGGVSNRAASCLSNVGSNRLTGSFVPTADVTGISGIECVLDMIFGDGTSSIPAWWDFIGTDTGSNGCRPGSLTANGGPVVTNTACLDWSAGTSVGGLADYSGGGSIPAANSPAHRRIKLGFAVAPQDSADLVATQEYFAFNLIIDNAKSVGLGACAGCNTPACIVFNSLNITPVTRPNQYLSTGTTASSNFATWQGAGPDCALVPVRRATWGQLKSLYH